MISVILSPFDRTWLMIHVIGLYRDWDRQTICPSPIRIKKSWRNRKYHSVNIFAQITLVHLRLIHKCQPPLHKCQPSKLPMGRRSRYVTEFHLPNRIGLLTSSFWSTKINTVISSPIWDDAINDHPSGDFYHSKTVWDLIQPGPKFGRSTLPSHPWINQKFDIFDSWNDLINKSK